MHTGRGQLRVRNKEGILVRQKPKASRGTFLLSWKGLVSTAPDIPAPVSHNNDRFGKT